jgi:hypothetical protein
VATIAAVGPGGAIPGETSWHGTAFGVDIRADVAIEGLQGLPAGARFPAAASLELVTGGDLKARCSGASRTVLVDRRHRDGRLMMAVDAFEGVGYRVAAPQHGRHLVAPDGRSVYSVLPDCPAWKWQRLFFAQVLPLVATLQGIELLHASGVVAGDRAYGFVAPSGTGKSTLAMNLVARGAQLLTDDVLALDTSRPDILAYPGGGLANVNFAEFDALDARARAALGDVIGRSDKVHLAARLAPGPAPLEAIYFLRRESGGTIRVDSGDAVSPRLLLSGRFIGYATEPHHLLAHLEAATAIAASIPRYTVTMPNEGPSAAVADVVLEHMEQSRRATL